MQTDVRLLDSTYSVGKNNVTVKFYGKTKDGEPVTLICDDYLPYMIVYNPTKEFMGIIASQPAYRKHEEITLEYKGMKDRFIKIWLNAPWSVREYRTAYELTKTSLVLSGNVAHLKPQLSREKGLSVSDTLDGLMINTDDPFHIQRVVQKYNLYEYLEPVARAELKSSAVFFSADIPFTTRYIYDHDLDSCVRVTGEEIRKNEIKIERFDKCEPFIPPLRILSLDLERGISNGIIYCIGISCYDEKEDKWAGMKIMSKLGENPDPFDLAADQRRMLTELVHIVNTLDPDVITGYFINSFDLQVLQDAAIKYLMVKGLPIGRGGEQMRKLPGPTPSWGVKGRLVLDAWTMARKELHPKREGLGYVAEMLFGDKKLDVNASKIDEEWKANPEKVAEYCLHDAELALRVLTHPRVNAINKLMDLAVPARLPVKEVSGGQGRMIESLLVRMVDREGIACPCSKSEVYEYQGAFVYDTKPGLWEWVIGLDFSSMYPSQIKKHNICFTTYTEDEDKEADVSPTGARFVRPGIRTGIVPRMVQGLLDSRKQAKALMKKAKEDGDAERADYYNRLQNAIKIMANATYGYFGTKFCRWPYNKYIAPSITAWAREDIIGVVKTLEKRGYTVVAGDTDSVFFTTGEAKSVEDCIALGKQVQEEFSTGGLNLEVEKIMRRFFAHAKKRYFGKIIWPEESLLVRGYEPRRTDSFDLQSEAMTTVFNLVLDGKPDEAVKFSKKIVEDTMKGRIDTTMLIQSKSISDEDGYDNPDSLPHVNAARLLKSRGFNVSTGSKVPFIVTDASRTPMRVEPVMEGVEIHAKPDYRYYARRIAASLARITEAFGCDEYQLLMGDSQKSISDWI